MDVIRARTSARNKEISSPERVKLYVQPKMKPFKKVQILYYLCRNGQLEHPHFMEVTHLATQPLRLKDVIDRLTVLRGKILPSLFSWSCKRSYKNGYVWNDLSEKDVIHPAEGAEYILKGSEVIEGCAEKFQQLQVISNKQQNPEPNFHPKRRFQPQQHRESELDYNIRTEDHEDEEDDEEEEELEEEKRSNSTSSNKSSSQCSRGVSTDEDLKTHSTTNPSEITLDHDTSPSPPPSTSSTLSEKAQPNNNNNNNNNNSDDSVTESMLTRGSSTLFQFIACGSSAAIKERNSMSGRKSITSSLHRDVLCKNITASSKMISDDDDINYMSENPRFGNPQSEEKEYFSGSIVESVDRVATEPVLKKSSSYNEERSRKSGLDEVMTRSMEEEKAIVVEEKKKSMKGKCIPRKMISTSISSYYKQAKK